MSDYISLRDAIELCGPRVIDGWKGSERYAPSRGELIVERTKILEFSDEAIFADAKDTDRNRLKRLKQEHDTAGQPLTHITDAINDARDKLQAEIACAKDKRRKTILKKALLSLLETCTAKPVRLSKDDRIKEHRNYLLDQVEKAQALAVAARERWNTMHDRLRRAVAKGAMEAHARFPLDTSELGIIRPLAAELFPDPGEFHLDLPYEADGERFHAEVVLLRDDINRVFPEVASTAHTQAAAAVLMASPSTDQRRQGRRLVYMAPLRQFLAKADANSSDLEIARAFRRWTKAPLPQKNREIAKQVKLIRSGS